MAVELIYAAVIGLLVGFLFHRVAVFQVRKRSDDALALERMKNPRVLVLWLIISAALFATTFYKFDDTVTRIFTLVFISVALDIMAVDVDIRKIPNEAVLFLFLAKIGEIIARVVQGQSFREVITASVLGLVVGFVIYIIPSKFKVPIGAGDIKYCAAIGFCLGIYGFLQSAIIMALGVLIYWLYLKISKRGSMRTVTMMGPYLSLGALFTLLMPVADIVNLLK